MKRFKLQPITVTGYHGTSLKAAEEILKVGFKPSLRPWEWLGHGIYFWQDAPIRAYDWAGEWLARKGYQGPVAVVAAEISLTGFVDLLDQQGMRLLQTFACEFLRKEASVGLTNTHPQNRLDCALFNFATNVLSYWGEQVSGYRAACVEGNPLTPGSPILDLSHVQLVVLDGKSILRKWIVETDEKGTP